MNAGGGPDASRPRSAATLVAGLAFVAALVPLERLGAERATLVYAASFWHYYLYWVAYRFGTVSPAAFRRDAIAMRTVSLVVGAAVYFAAPLDLLSLLVVAAGFTVNAMAALRLGTERTFYGEEVAGLRPLRVSAFPYSVIPHPMLLANVVAYAGTMLNSEFREQWWPLASAHVVLNLALVELERSITPLRGRTPGNRLETAVRTAVCGPRAARRWTAAGAIAAVATLALAPSRPELALDVAIGAGALAYAGFLYGAYSSPAGAAARTRST